MKGDLDSPKKILGGGGLLTEDPFYTLLAVSISAFFSSQAPTSRGATGMSRGYQARPKIHVIRVVFQDQALYVRTSFRGAKTCKIGKKGVFLVI